MKETASCSTDSELAELRERAQRAIDENIVLIADYKFLRALFRTRPMDRVRPSPMLDD